MASRPNGRPRTRDLIREQTSAKQQRRYDTLCRTIEPLAAYFSGRHVLDYGGGSGLSAAALVEHGAAETVDVVDPGEQYIDNGRRFVTEWGHDDRITLQHVPDTRSLPYADEQFGAILANAVLEHIPQPRDDHIRELWRVLRPGGYLVVNETPNKYLPRDVHTTGLWWIPWMPRELARRYAIRRGRFRPDAPWESSGWRGIGYYELVRGFATAFRLIPETSRWRHRVLNRLGLPASMFDPYPTWIFRKA